MNKFTISQLQEYSGIKAHTIRIWEQRYNALTPNRSEGNTRSYDNEQLRRLLNIVSLLDKKHKISHLCALSDNELADLIEDEYSHSNEEDDNISLYVNQLLSSAFDFDETKFEKIFATCILRFGLKNTYSQVLYPTLKRLGVFWSKDAVLPAHEHFITNLIKQKILTAIDSFDPPTDKKAPWLLFLPEDEFHEMGLLMAYFLLRHEGHKVIYLGANIPISTLGDTIELVKPKNVLSFFVGKKDDDKNMEIIKELSSLNPKISFNLACQSNTSNLPSKKNINLVFSITDFETILD